MPTYYPKADKWTIINLVWPQLLMMFLQFGIAFVCVWVAGRIDPVVQASFGMIMQSVMFLQVLAMAVGTGAVTVISQSLGAGLEVRARRYVLLVLVGSLGLGMLIALLGHLFRAPFFNALRAPAETLEILDLYWSVTLLTTPLMYVWNVSAVVFRAIRKVLPPLWITFLVFLIISLGSTGLGLGWWGLPNCGYMGIAWSNFVATLLGVMVNIAVLLRLGYARPADLPSWAWVRQAGPKLVRVAWPAGLSQLLWQLGYLVIFAITASLPVGKVAALAGMTAGIRIESFVFMPALAFHMTASVLVGNSLGAGDKAEARRLAILLVTSGSIFVTSVVLCMWPFMEEMAALLSGSEAVQKETASYLFYNLLSAPFSTAGVILGGVMVGAGATRYNLIVFGGCFWLLRLPVAWIFGHLVWGDAAGVFLSMLVSQCAQALIMIWIFLRLDWTRFALIRRGPNM